MKYTPFSLSLNAVCLIKKQRKLLDNIKINFASSGITVILGHNGAGKSLLMQACNGLIPISSGEIKPEPQELNQLFLPQQPLIFKRSVRQNIEHPLLLAGQKHSLRQSQTDKALELCQLTDIQHQPAPTLSGGEKQRVAIARAWALGASTIWLDEPCAHLDPKTTRKIDSLLATLTKQSHRLILCTHDIAQAKRLADDIIFIDSGRLIEHSDAETFFNAPSSAQAAKYLAHE